MKKYMIIYEIDDSDEYKPVQGTSFADTYAEARNKKMDVECGLGAYAELYAREEREAGQPPEYVLIEA